MAVTAKKKAKKTAKSTTLQPLGERIVVERESSLETTAGGIVLPGSAQDKPSRGTVISVGEGRVSSRWNEKPPPSKAWRRCPVHLLWSRRN
jgi:chaperonin GroES